MAYGDHNNPVYSSANGLAETDKTDKVSNTTLADRDQTMFSQDMTQTGYSKKSDKLYETKVIRKRKDRGPNSDPQIEYMNNRSAGEDSNPYKFATISSIVKKPRENIEKVYHRKNNKRPLGSPKTGHLKSKSDNKKDCVFNSERFSCSAEGKMVEPSKSASFDITTGKYIDPEKAWCMTILKKYGVCGQFSQTPSYAEHPGVVGDGTCNRTCKTCNGLEDARTLICDMCEESFHMSCCKPKVKSKPVQDWVCPTCKTKRKKGGLKVSTNCEIESKYSYRLREMLDENASYTTQVRIGKEYQADIPECTGESSHSSENPFIGVVVSLKEKILEKELAEENLKNNIRVKNWKPANALPPGSKEIWLQCKSTIYKKGEVCSDGRKAKTDIICGKWRRAPLSEVQNEKWDCSCAVVWDPYHADCFVPQELETAEIQRRMEKYKQELETAEIQRRMEKCKQMSFSRRGSRGSQRGKGRRPNVICKEGKNKRIGFSSRFDANSNRYYWLSTGHLLLGWKVSPMTFMEPYPSITDIPLAQPDLGNDGWGDIPNRHFFGLANWPNSQKKPPMPITSPVVTSANLFAQHHQHIEIKSSSLKITS